MDRCPHTEFFCMTSLAEGADQLCGRIASDLGMQLIVPLPMEQAVYETDFRDTALDAFRALLAQAASVIIAPDTEKLHDESRDYAYRQAGIYIARHCHVLLALWDGLAGESGCCGTAQTVDFKTKRTYRLADSLLSVPNEGIVLQIVTPRISGKELPEASLTAQLIENASDTLLALMEDTDGFNQDAAGIDASKSVGVFDTETMRLLGQAAEPLQQLYRLADALALRNRDIYLSMLKWLCATGALLVVMFLLYDECEANLFLIAYGLIATIALILFLLAKRGRCHRKYVEYRLFAETLRVQLNLLASGLVVDTEELMTWSQRMNCPWIRAAMHTLPQSGQTKPDVPADVRTIWMRAQLRYQKDTHAKNRAKQKRQRSISGALLTLTILFFATVLLLEFLFPVWIGYELSLPDWFSRFALTHSEHFFSTRSIFKILLGIIPALTFVVSSYYGKLSLERKLKDGQRMIALYSEAIEVFDNPRTDKAQLLTELAREELAETCDWLSYLAENRPDILL
jgi:hypothetical protein